MKQEKPTTNNSSGDVSPDSLLRDFRGRPIVSILIFTVIVHVVVVGVFSFGYLKDELLGEDTATLSADERLDLAVREATSSLREIAESHGVSPQELSDQFASRGARPTSNTGSTAATPETPATDTGDPISSEPQSAIEKELQQQAEGPAVPELPPLEEQDDLFQ